MPAVGERLSRIAAVSALLLSVLSGGLAPHFHVAASNGSEAVSAAADAGAPAAAVSDSGECTACRSGQSTRHGVAPTRDLTAPAETQHAGTLHSPDVVAAAARLVRAAAPPRAPPV